MIVTEKHCTTKRSKGIRLTAQPFREYLVQENISFFGAFTRYLSFSLREKEDNDDNKWLRLCNFK
jgi:hypothetical protein